MKKSKKDLQINLLRTQMKLLHHYLSKIHELSSRDIKPLSYENDLDKYKSLADSIMSECGMEVD